MMTEKTGQQYLRAILPKLRAEVATMGDDDVRFARNDPRTQAFIPYLRDDNLDALMIYPAAEGGWHADLVLRHTPPNMPDTLGTPESSPCATQQDAIRHGHALIRFALVMARQNHNQSAAPEPAFILYSIGIRLSPQLSETLLSHPEHSGGVQPARQRLEQVLTLLWGEDHGEITADQLHALSAENAQVLLTAIHLSALSGLDCYP